MIIEMNEKVVEKQIMDAYVAQLIALTKNIYVKAERIIEVRDRGLEDLSDEELNYLIDLQKDFCHEYDLMFNLFIRIRDLAKASDDPDAKMTAQMYEQFIPIVDNMRNEVYALLDELAEN